MRYIRKKYLQKYTLFITFEIYEILKVYYLRIMLKDYNIKSYEMFYHIYGKPSNLRQTACDTVQSKNVGIFFISDNLNKSKTIILMKTI